MADQPGAGEPAEYFFVIGYFAAYADAIVRFGISPWPITQAIIDKAWRDARWGAANAAEFDRMRAQANGTRSGQLVGDSNAGDAVREALEKLRPLSERATWGPWCWEQCGDKCDAPVVGIAMPDADENGERCYAGRLTDDAAHRYGRIASEWHDCDGHSASANADFAVAAVNFVRALLAKHGGAEG